MPTATLSTNTPATDGATIRGDVLGNGANLDPSLSNVILSTNAGIKPLPVEGRCPRRRQLFGQQAAC